MVHGVHRADEPGCRGRLARGGGAVSLTDTDVVVMVTWGFTKVLILGMKNGTTGYDMVLHMPHTAIFMGTLRFSHAL